MSGLDDAGVFNPEELDKAMGRNDVSPSAPAGAEQATTALGDPDTTTDDLDLDSVEL